MKLIKRNYLEELISVMGTPDIKVITGVRRSGKSKLLELFKEYVVSNVTDANIIEVDFNNYDYDELKESHALNNYVESKYDKSKTNFVLIDEVQMCKDFEKVICSLHNSEKYDIYITGSNAFLLSSDLATLFTGRTFEISVLPFSFAEYLTYYHGDENDNLDSSLIDIHEELKNYVLLGGMSGSYLYKDNKQKYDYIKKVYDTSILRDIIQKSNIRNTYLFERISDFMLSNASNITSVRNISNILSNNDNEVSNKTVGQYVDYLTKAFLFYKVRRYDIEGKKYLESQDKYYLVDPSFKYAKLGTKNIDYGRVYENIVAMELIRRGYQIYVGKTYKSEVDFVAMKRDEQLYIQVSDNISDEKTFEREVTPLLKIKDAYPKIIIANTYHDTYQYEGVQIYDLAKWLLNLN